MVLTIPLNTSQPGDGRNRWPHARSLHGGRHRHGLTENSGERFVRPHNGHALTGCLTSLLGGALASALTSLPSSSLHGNSGTPC